MMARTDGWKEWVARASHLSPAAQTLAVEYLEHCTPLEEGNAASVEHLSRAILAQAPLLLELYLRPSLSVEAITTAINLHNRHCAERRGQADENGNPIPLNTRRLVFSVIKASGPWGVLLYTLIAYKEAILKLIGV